MKVTQPIKILGKRILRPLLYRFPPLFLSSTSLYTWLDTLKQTEDLEGNVVEIGCYLGGSAIMSVRFLRTLHSKRKYFVMDTFGGFVKEQFESEIRHGGARFLQHEFSGNSPALTRWVLNKHGAQDVEMIQGDATKLPAEQIPSPISACLLDIDLADPIYETLKRIYPLLVPGGMVAVDDCDDETHYKARIGYNRFMQEYGLPPEIRLGMGIVTKPR